ncbi:MAG: PEP/pyruvate-binding domain-containing protein, partial [Candidatus Neomarinimicrobiota bacterium]|nr:PEP/pyruvate-binding domain-containing protein [Candidatus Neomarinimicrobiota bacterium]
FPLAIRSSSLLEDSQYQPLAGMYATYMLPNSNKSKTTRLEELTKAIKLVYASTYLKEPKSLIEGSVHHHEEEKMAVIVMELVGKSHANRFYPSASGLAQSFNYYPVSYMKRKEGVAYLALGLGRTIAEGEKSLRFSPKYPGIIPQYFSVRSTIDNSQNQFYALDLNKGMKLLKHGLEENTSLFDLNIAEKDGELDWSASVVSNEDNVVRDSLRFDGTRVITFPSLLKWKTLPITDLLLDLLKLGESSLGCPVEIEFAINMHDTEETLTDFCLLQIKPMVVGGLDRIQDFDSIQKKNILCKSSVALGNGLIENINNLIIVDPKNFDPSKTKLIAKQIEKINNELSDLEQYVLIGPGRWGSADPWLGIPVEWDQISKAKVIVEYGMDSFPVDPSFGSHFFQNVTSMRIGYFTINHKKRSDKIDMDWINTQQVKKKSKYIKWIKLDKPITVTIDGQTGEGNIIKPLEPIEEKMDEHETSGI